MAQTDFDKLFSILRSEPTLEALINPFVKAYEEDAGKQLIGQISGAAVILGILSTEKLYYILSGDDFTMSINDPKHPKVVCIANNPQAANVYSALISLYLSNLQKLLKEQEEQPCGIMLEEFANISWPGVDKFLSVCRSYLVSTTLVIQDAGQLIMHYGKQQADVILAMVGNVISGQVTGDSAKALSERFGKIMQDRRSLSTNSGTVKLGENQIDEIFVCTGGADIPSNTQFVKFRIGNQNYGFISPDDSAFAMSFGSHTVIAAFNPYDATPNTRVLNLSLLDTSTGSSIFPGKYVTGVDGVSYNMAFTFDNEEQKFRVLLQDTVFLNTLKFEGVGGMIHVKFKTNVVLHGGSGDKLPVEGEALVRRVPN